MSVEGFTANYARETTRNQGTLSEAYTSNNPNQFLPLKLNNNSSRKEALGINRIRLVSMTGPDYLIYTNSVMKASHYITRERKETTNAKET
jgi:hypothetical protein